MNQTWKMGYLPARQVYTVAGWTYKIHELHEFPANDGARFEIVHRFTGEPSGRFHNLDDAQKRCYDLELEEEKQQA